MKKINAILQVRLDSSRLPGKALLPILERPVLSLLAERIKKCDSINRLVVATSLDPSDDLISEVCAQESLECFRGSKEDVLDRIYQCAKTFEMNCFAKFTADNPLIDPFVCDQVIQTFLRGTYDYLSNNHPPTWPDGLEVEVMRFNALETAWLHAKKPYQREHVTPYIWDQPELFKIGNVVMADGIVLYKKMRWTLDYVEDYELIKRVYEQLYPSNPTFCLEDIVTFLEKNPDIQKLNKQRAAENMYSWYGKHLNELKTVRIDDIQKELE